MSQILKLTAFLLLLTTQAFSKQYYWYIPSFADTLVKVESTIIDSNHVRIGNDIYSMSVEETDYHLDSQKNFEKNTIYSMGEGGRKLIFKGNVIKVGCSSVYNHATGILKGECREELYDHPTYGNPKRHFHPFDFMKLEKITTCQPNEHFNTETQQCQSCPEGYSWDKENNRCYKDCTDVNKNKWGNTNGSCIDCSDKKTSDSVAECYCKFYGLLHLSNITANEGNGFYSTSCSDGGRFRYKDPTTPDVPKPDNNNTTPNNPGGGNTTPGGPGGGNGGPGGGNGGPGGDTPGPGGDTPGGGGPTGDNEFCKKNPNDPKCKGPGGDNEFCKKNPKDPRCKGPGGGGPSGNFDPDDNKDKDAKFNPDDFKYGDIEDMFKDIKDKLERAVTDNESKFGHFEDGIKQFIQNVQGNGLSSFSKSSAPNSCPKTYNIPIGAKSAQISFDLCKILEPVRPVVYYIVYISTFSASLFLVIKLMIFSF